MHDGVLFTRLRHRRDVQGGQGNREKENDQGVHCELLCDRWMLLLFRIPALRLLIVY